MITTVRVVIVARKNAIRHRRSTTACAMKRARTIEAHVCEILDFSPLFCCLNVGRRPEPVNQCNTDSLVGGCPTEAGRAALTRTGPSRHGGLKGSNPGRRGVAPRFPMSSNFGSFPPTARVDDLYLRQGPDPRMLVGVFDGVISQTETRQRRSESRFIDVPPAIIALLHREKGPFHCPLPWQPRAAAVTACTWLWRHECTHPSRHPTSRRTFPLRPCIAHPSCLRGRRPLPWRTCASPWHPRQP
jgi:hypothetical protein